MRDPFSALSHALGLLVAIYVTALLIRLRRGNRRVLVFGLSLCLLYAASALYHTVRDEPYVTFCRNLDLCAIFILIAGTTTGAFAALPRSRSTDTLLGVVWALAVIGVVCKWILPAEEYALTLALFAALTAVAALSLPAFGFACGRRGFGLVLGGLLCYAAGGIFDFLEWPVLVPGLVGPHDVLHVFDLIGSALHLAFVIRYAVPRKESGHGRHEENYLPASACDPVRL